MPKMGCSFTAVLALCVSCVIFFNQADAQMNADPLGFNELNEEFVGDFVNNLIESGIFGKAEDKDFTDITESLTKAIKMLRSSKNSPASEKRTLMMAFASELAELIVGESIDEVSLMEQISAVTKALRYAYEHQGEHPNEDLIREVELMVGVFLDVDSSDSSYSDDTMESEIPGIPFQPPQEQIQPIGPAPNIDPSQFITGLTEPNSPPNNLLPLPSDPIPTALDPANPTPQNPLQNDGINLGLTKPNSIPNNLPLLSDPTPTALEPANQAPQLQSMQSPLQNNYINPESIPLVPQMTGTGNVPNPSHTLSLPLGNLGKSPYQDLELSAIENVFKVILKNGHSHIPDIVMALKKAKSQTPRSFNLRILVNQLSSTFANMIHNNSDLSRADAFLQLMIETLVSALEVIRIADDQCVKDDIPMESPNKYIKAFNDVLF